MAEDYVLQTKITADSTEFQNAIKGVSDSLNGIKKSLTKATDSIKKGTANWGLDLDKFYDKGSGIFKSFGVDIDKFASHFGVSGKLVSAITVATVALTKFGQSMNGARAELAKGTGAIGEDLIKLQDTFHKAMIEGIGRDAKEVGGMMADLNTRFGVTGGELVAMTDEFDKFAEVMGVDARQAINTTADIMAKWGLETEKLSPLLDQLTTASQMSGATIDELTNGLKQGQAVFSQFGMSATDSIAMLSSFAKNGLETTTAINSMRFALNTFSKEGIDAKKGLEETTEAIKTASSETEALSIASSVFGAKNGAEMVKVLKSGALSADEFKTALINAGGALEATEEASRTSADAFEDLKATLKGTFAGFGEGFDNLFRDLIDSIKEVVKFIAPVIEPIGNIFRDVFSAIGQMLKILVDNFIEFQKRYNTVFSAVTSVIQTVYETIHKVLSNIVEMFGTAFSFIFAILDGKWGLAWEYAKKQALLFSKNISDILSGIVDLFAKMINGVIEKLNSAIDLYHKLPKSIQIFDIQNIDKISESIDLASKWNITGKLAETQQKIDELTGKASEKIIGDLGKVKEVSTDVSDTMKSEAMEVSQISIDWSNKLLQQEIAVLEKEREDAVNSAKLKKQTEREIFDIKKSYADKIYALQVKQIEAQREAEIKKVKASKESLESQKDLIAKINKYYDTQKSLIKDSTSFIEKSDKAIKKSSNSWDSWIKSFEDKANDWTTMTVDMANIGTQAMGDMFTQIGEGLVNGGNGFEEYSAMAVKAVAEILKSLSAQLSAEAAVAAAHYDYATAAAAAAGAAAALVAAGTLTAVASNMKKTSDATKDASMSLEEFRKKLNEIWSGETTSISVVHSIRQIDDVVKNTTESVAKASAEYEKWSSSAYNAKKAYEEFSKTVTNQSMAQTASELRNAAWNLDWIAKTYKDKLSVEQKKLKEAQESYLKGLKETEDELKNQIKEYEELNKEYQTLYGSLNGYTSEMVRSQAIVSKYASIVRNEMLVNTKSLLNTVYNAFSSYGKTIGENLMDSIVDGATKSDFLNNIKEYVRKQMLQLAIYTDSFTSEIADIGTEMVKSLMSDGTGLDVLTDRLSDLYDRTSEIAEKIDETLEKSFSKFETVADKALSKYDELSAKLKELTQNATQNLSAFVDGYRGVEKESSNLVKTMSSLYTDSTKVLSGKQSTYQYYNSIYEEASKNAEKYASEISSLKDKEEALLKERDEAIKGLYMMSIFNKDSNSEPVQRLQAYLFQIYRDIDIVENSISYAKESYKEYAIEVQSVQPYLTKAQEEYNKALVDSNDIYTKYQEAVKNYTYLYEQTLKDTSANLREQNETLTDQIGIYKKLYTASNQYEKEMLGLNVLNTIKSQLMSVISDVANAGVTIGDTLISSILSGADSAGFLSNMKSYIKENVIKLAVYTESFQNMLADVGTKMIQALTGGNKSQLESLKKDLESLYNTAKIKAEGLENIIDDVFPDIKETVTDNLDKIEDSLTSFEKAMKNFNESIEDMGGDIASQLVNGLTNGLGQSDFLKNMKDWIKKMLVQSVVYTESMKSEIEAIGKSLTSAIANGFSEDSMHAIRRDLSYIFEQANKAVGSIDSVLSGVFSGYASGTENATRGLHIVGESGPELVAFKGGERVYNNAESMRMLNGASSGGNNFNVTFNNLQDTSAFAMMNQLKQYNRELAINSII